MKLIIRTISFLFITAFLNFSYSEILPIEDYDEISENIFFGFQNEKKIRKKNLWKKLGSLNRCEIL